MKAIFLIIAIFVTVACELNIFSAGFEIVFNVFFYISLKGSTQITSENCTPGETYKVECNTCICSGNGNDLCTIMGCLSYKIHKKSFSEEITTQGD